MITKETLQKFCSTDETRPAILNPWTFGEWTYATDGRVMIRVPALAEIPTVSDHVVMTRANDLFSTPPETLLPFQPIPVEPPEKWGLECNNCEGKGRTKRVGCSECGSLTEIPVEIDCMSCNGRGRFLHEALVRFGRYYLNAYYLDLLRSNLSNVELAEKDTKDPMDEIAVRFDGGTGWLMPMRVKA